MRDCLDSSTQIQGGIPAAVTAGIKGFGLLSGYGNRLTIGICHLKLRDFFLA